MRRSLVCIVGCDGCGKSTVLREIAARAREVGLLVDCGHWRPGLLRVTSGSMAAEAATAPHSAPPRSMPASVAKLVLIACDWWLWAVRRQDQLALFDRYHGDLLVDPKRYRYGGPRWIARAWAAVLPQPSVLVYLSAPVSVLRTRKQEVSCEALERSAEAYCALVAAHPAGAVVEASRPLPEVIEEVWHLLVSRGTIDGERRQTGIKRATIE